LSCEQPLTPEHKKNYVLRSFLGKGVLPMLRRFVEEAAALTSLALFLGMIAIWAQVFATL